MHTLEVGPPETIAKLPWLTVWMAQSWLLSAWPEVALVLACKAGDGTYKKDSRLERPLTYRKIDETEVSSSDVLSLPNPSAVEMYIVSCREISLIIESYECWLIQRSTSKSCQVQRDCKCSHSLAAHHCER